MFADNWSSKFLRQFKSASRPYHILLKYTLLQIPALALIILILVLLQQWMAIPIYVVWGIPILWVLKDIVLFPLTWRSYESHSRHDPHPMVGRYGIAQQALAPSGYVRVGGELWLAEIVGNEGSIEKGERIRVREVNGLKLLVDREGGTSGS
jgi:membrane protein implicated in regulation of membrane protease activity